MEMMIVLLIVAIIAAASAPLVTKRLARNAGTGDSPWVFTGLNNNIAYNMSGDVNSAVIIGASEVNRTAGQAIPKLYIESSGDEPQIGFGSRGLEGYVSLLFDRNNNRVAFTDSEVIPNNSVMLGVGQTVLTTVGNTNGNIAIGSNTTNYNTDSIAIGRAANAMERSVTIGRETISDGSGAVVIGELAETDNTALRAIALGGAALANGPHSIAIGGQRINGRTTANTRAIAIGAEAQALGNKSIAIGGSSTNRTIANGENSIAIGSEADTTNAHSIAIGSLTTATNGGVAIGRGASATAQSAVAIGDGASATGTNSVAIGRGVNATADQIVLGTATNTVRIPGDLIVTGRITSSEGITAPSASINGSISSSSLSATRVSASSVNGVNITGVAALPGDFGINPTYYVVGRRYSDKRLKNIGEKYTAGLAELKKLDFFHYTFKGDENKTPHVGVIAQDLEKVFPEAISKDENGYLSIRCEDMFYAVINAVKELDSKITEIVKSITDISLSVEKQAEINTEQDKTIEQQQKIIEEQQKLIKNLENRIEKLENKKG